MVEVKNIIIFLVCGLLLFGCSTYKAPIRAIKAKMENCPILFLNKNVFKESRNLVLEKYKKRELKGEVIIFIESFVDVSESYACEIYSSKDSIYTRIDIDLLFNKKKIVYKLNEKKNIIDFNSSNLLESIITAIQQNKLNELIQERNKYKTTPETSYIVTIAKNIGNKILVNQYFIYYNQTGEAEQNSYLL